MSSHKSDAFILEASEMCRQHFSLAIKAQWVILSSDIKSYTSISIYIYVHISISSFFQSGKTKRQTACCHGQQTHLWHGLIS